MTHYDITEDPKGNIILILNYNNRGIGAYKNNLFRAHCLNITPSCQLFKVKKKNKI